MLIDAAPNLAALPDIQDLPGPVAGDAEYHVNGRHVGEICVRQGNATEIYSANRYFDRSRHFVLLPFPYVAEVTGER
jgi:hypothetical protein